MMLIFASCLIVISFASNGFCRSHHRNYTEEEKEFGVPTIASIEIKNAGFFSHVCTGTFVQRKEGVAVLTAAYCFRNISNNLDVAIQEGKVRVVYGPRLNQTELSQRIKLKVTKIVIHKNYQRSSAYPQQNDLALVYLDCSSKNGSDQNLTLTLIYTRFFREYERMPDIPYRAKVIVQNYVKKDYPTLPKLTEAQEEVVSTDDCSQKAQTPISRFHSICTVLQQPHIFAASSSGGVFPPGACFDDIGAPLFLGGDMGATSGELNERQRPHYQIGVRSQPLDYACSPETTEVYVAVQFFRDWIEGERLNSDATLPGPMKFSTLVISPFIVWHVLQT